MQEITSPPSLISNLYADEWPRERLLALGKDALSNAELLAILINNGTQGVSALEIARTLLGMADNSLIRLARFDVNTLRQVKGIGPKKAVTLIAALELGARRRLAGALDKPEVDTSEKAYEVVGPMLADLNREEFVVLYLNRASRVIGINKHSKGGIAGTIVDIRLLLKDALLCEASGMIVAHNHPSGSTSPSKSDIQLTRKIKEAAATMEINLLDHLIVTADSYTSFSDRGLL